MQRRLNLRAATPPSVEPGLPQATSQATSGPDRASAGMVLLLWFAVGFVGMATVLVVAPTSLWNWGAERIEPPGRSAPAAGASIALPAIPSADKLPTDTRPTTWSPAATPTEGARFDRPALRFTTALPDSLKRVTLAQPGSDPADPDVVGYALPASAPDASAPDSAMAREGATPVLPAAVAAPPTALPAIAAIPTVTQAAGLPAIPTETAVPPLPPLRVSAPPPKNRTQVALALPKTSRREGATPVLPAAVAAPPTALPAIAAIPTVTLAAGLPAISTETAVPPLPPANAPDETVLAALLPAAAPAADTTPARALYPAPLALATHAVPHYPASARDVVDAAAPLAQPQAPAADAPPTLMAAAPAAPPVVAGVAPSAGVATILRTPSAPHPAAGLSRGADPARLAVPGSEPTAPPASAPDKTALAALLPAAAPAADTAPARALYPAPLVLVVRVMLHYPPGARDAADAAIAALEAAGVTEAVAVPVSFDVPFTDVCFFQSTDRAAADGVASLLARGVAGAAPRARDFTHFSPRPARGRLEVWLAGAKS